VTAGATPSKLTLESRDSLNSAWQSEIVAFQSISATQFRVTLTPATSVKTKFYRVRGE